MGTKRLIRLVALVALLGGASIYYTTQVVPTQMGTSTSEMILVAEPVTSDDEVVESENSDSMADSPAVESAPVIGDALPAAGSGASGSAAQSIDADIAALDNLVDGTYDDSALESSITSDGSAVLDQTYDF